MLVHDHVATMPDGSVVRLDRYRGRVLLVVNTASRCGFTPQYAGLQALQDRFAARGFSVLAFPCNQFGGQEPGTDAEIAQFCETNYHAGFPIFAKTEVNGANAAPLFRFLARSKRGWLGSAAIKWNFTKFLVDRDGRPVRRFAPSTRPEAVASTIEALLPG